MVDGPLARAYRSLPVRLLSTLIDPRRLYLGIPGLVHFVRDALAYTQLAGAEPISLRDLDPQVHDRQAISPYDKHYFHQDVWAANRIAERRPRAHVDVGSNVNLVGFLTALTNVVFIDIRPLPVSIERLRNVKGDVLALPLEDRSVISLSCLHVAEHVGLGRYGDRLDPAGTRKAALELQRVLGPGGELLFSLPVGHKRLCFNAHRVHSPSEVLQLFPELELNEFSGVDDFGEFRRYRDLDELAQARYACGMFRFGRPA